MEKGEEKSSNRCFIMELPTELLAMVSDHLDPLSGACLAMACKRLLLISGASLVSDCLQFKKDFAPLFHHYRSNQSFQTDRWQLLERLEDERWLACSKCLKLHPHVAFTSKELRRESYLRACNLGELAGVVDLCPCRKLTFQDKVNLVQHLKDREAFTKMPSSILGSHSYDDRYLWHSCKAIYGNTEVSIEIYPEIDDDERLMIRTEYRLYVEPNRLGKHQYITPRFGCAHRSMDLWLSSVCQTLYCHRYNSFCSACKRINVCSTCDTTLKCPKKRPFHCQETNKMAYFFWTQRCLGRSTDIPDKEWAVQRIHPVESHVTWNNCRELCPWTIRMHPPPNHAPSLGNDILDPALEESSEDFASQVYTSLHLE
ncbi:hypothetical protein BGW36DRAFT_365389 [Talaromyces proteolyticus]|uniref:F-box domain-containing protein n=1 Tax=Talaromyces proteolyticus TaxID=1131652 RepID=A0AAD4KHM6_9EURO|nr:uncharacterized protein BGW36DRAFT_365389 [Talaromyces proteolyticus]KAH8689619.1 hypothetical protein BGW36DRAFT_365389 [Talaromyces proteolyticus]